VDIAHNFSLANPSLCELQSDRDADGYPTLGLIKPNIERLVIKPCSPEWSAAQINALRQTSLFQKAPVQELEKIPFDFSYEFRCQIRPLLNSN
jgi:hypothetical protein